MRPHRPARAMSIALAATLVALACGCGARWSDAERQAVLARGQSGSGTRATAGAGTGSASVTTTPGATSAGGGSTAAGTGGAATGSGGGDTTGAGAAAASGPLPCSAPSDAPGVTNDTITIGNISTVSGPVPGLGASAVAAARGYVAYLNANGGVCGRQVEMKTADDGADNGTFRSITSQMAPSVLGFVGQTGGGDAGGADIIESQQIPVVTAAFSTQYSNVSTVFDLNPPYADTSQSIGKYKYIAAQGVTKAAIVFIAVDQSRDQIESTEKPLMEAAGIQVVNYQPLPLSTLSYDSAARGVANSGAEYLLFLGGYSQNSSMATSMYETGYKGLKFNEYYTSYGTNFIELAGSAAEGAVSWSYSIPTEEASSHPEAKKYVEWMGQVAPDARPDVFSAQAWASAKAFFTALEQLPGPISREAVVNQLRTFTSFDADGFYQRINLGEEKNLGCFIGMHVVSGLWTRMAPAQGFLC